MTASLVPQPSLGVRDRTASKHRVLVSAGEPSGDANIADVMNAVRTGMDFHGLGGTRMAAAGAVLSTRMESLTTIGFTSLPRAIPAHVRLFASMRRDLRTRRFDLALLTDYPGFHMRVAREAARWDTPVLYYVAPQLWAWGEGRIDRLRRSVTHLAVILPFEETFFRRRGVPTTFVGHPVLDRQRVNRSTARARLGIADSNLVLGLFPGSRASEVRHMWPVLRDSASRVREALPEVEVVVAAMPGLEYGPGGKSVFRLHRCDAATVMAASDAALCKSGTSTLEAAVADTPLVVCYRTDALSYQIAKRLVRCRNVGLVNLVAGREVAPEYIQSAATAAELAHAVLPLLDSHGRAATRQREAFGLVRHRLGTPGAARRVADLASDMMSC